jgi:hypothetical protein
MICTHTHTHTRSLVIQVSKLTFTRTLTPNPKTNSNIFRTLILTLTLNHLEIAFDLVGINKMSSVGQIFVCLLFLWALLVPTRIVKHTPQMLNTHTQMHMGHCTTTSNLQPNNCICSFYFK